MKKKKLEYIDLFAGCGGFSLGLHESGRWKGLFAIEKDSMAFETLKHNLIDKKKHFSWPDWLPCTNHDINNITKKYLGELKKLQGKVDLVVGGPPCQGFSTAGRRIENDKRNKLVYSYLEFIGIIRPKVIVFENVKGFSIGFKKNSKTQQRGKSYLDLVLEKLRTIGYHDAAFKILKFSDFGVPQDRQRVIIIASLDGALQKDFFEELSVQKVSFLNRKGITEPLTLEQVISDLEMKNGLTSSPDSKGFNAGLYRKKKISAYQLLMRKDYEGDVPDSHRFANHTKRVTLKFSEIIEKKLSNKDIQHKFNTKKCSTKLLNKDSISPTLTTLPDDYVHYSEPRILTVREYARIQTFPDCFEFKGKYTTGGSLRTKEVPRYSQIGNAVPPFFGELCGCLIPELLNAKQ